MTSVSKEACDARKAFHLTTQWCYEAINKSPEEMELAEDLRRDALEHMRTVEGHNNTHTHFHEEAFQDDYRRAIRRSGKY